MLTRGAAPAKHLAGLCGATNGDFAQQTSDKWSAKLFAPLAGIAAQHRRADRRAVRLSCCARPAPAKCGAGGIEAGLGSRRRIGRAACASDRLKATLHLRRAFRLGRRRATMTAPSAPKRRNVRTIPSTPARPPIPSKRPVLRKILAMAAPVTKPTAVLIAREANEGCCCTAGRGAGT